MQQTERDKLIAQANLLAILTIGYNFGGGIVSMVLGGADETLALFGFESIPSSRSSRRSASGT